MRVQNEITIWKRGREQRKAWRRWKGKGMMEVEEKEWNELFLLYKGNINVKKESWTTSSSMYEHCSAS